MKPHLSLLAQVASLSCALLLPAASRATDYNAETVAFFGVPRLVGVWHISAQPVNCANNLPLPVSPITGIMAFHAGGTSTEAGPTVTPRTPGLGTWRMIGYRRFTASATVLNFDVNGFSTGSLVVRRTIDLAKGGESFKATVRTTITDVGGIEILRCAMADATRAAE